MPRGMEVLDDRFPIHLHNTLRDPHQVSRSLCPQGIRWTETWTKGRREGPQALTTDGFRPKVRTPGIHRAFMEAPDDPPFDWPPRLLPC
jgi:hypothetical protein